MLLAPEKGQFKIRHLYKLSRVSDSIGPKIAHFLNELWFFIYRKRIQPMTAYEFYWRDEGGNEHLFGILPERRKGGERITADSIINWGKSVVSSIADSEKMYFLAPVKIKE